MTDAPPAHTFPHRTPKGPRKPRDPDAPAHYRLSTETWLLILKEYVEGATAPELSLKWRVSEHAIRKRITEHQATKRDWGDEQVLRQAVEREAELEAARRNSPEAVAGRLFDGIGPPDDLEADDPAVLARTATVASGRAMRGRLWSEARALAGLAESYARLGQKAAATSAAAAAATAAAAGAESGGGGGGANGGVGWTAETLPLWRLVDILMDPEGVVARRFGRMPPEEFDPDADIKAVFWEQQLGAWEAVKSNIKELMFRAVYAEKALRERGGTPRIGVTDVEIEAWARDWLSAPPSEANYLERTRLGAWPWRGGEG